VKKQDVDTGGDSVKILINAATTDSKKVRVSSADDVEERVQEGERREVILVVRAANDAEAWATFPRWR
jgi:recombinational DNA repair protein RecR